MYGMKSKAASLFPFSGVEQNAIEIIETEIIELIGSQGHISNPIMS